MTTKISGVSIRASLVAVALSLALLFPAAARAAVALDPVCGAAARRVAAESGVPHDVLAAISLTETGRRKDGATRTWPWTVNSEGKGFWFDSHEEALRFARSELAQGTVSFDVGCFQINYRWHGESFGSVEEMFDPLANARYAARFLTELYRELGDWSRAAGAYHSRTQEYAQRYRARFDALRAEVDFGAAATETRLAAADPSDEPRANGFPLLVASNSSRSAGSLVPLGGLENRRFIPLTSAGALR